MIATWRLSCPVCHAPVSAADGLMLLNQTVRLARHLRLDHPFELRLLEVALSAPERPGAAVDAGRAADGAPDG